MNILCCDIVKHIVNVYRRNNLPINESVVAYNFNKLMHNDALCTQFSDIIDRLYGKCISESALIGFVDTVVNGPINEGFENPFVDDSDSYDEQFVNAYDDVKTPNYIQIKSVSLYDPRSTRHTYYKDGAIYSGRQFVKGDLIEECPVKILDKMDMYARSVRDLAFEVDPSKHLFGMPYGFANLYATSNNPEEANMDYEFDPQDGIIRFYALRHIPMNQKLVLLVGEEYIS